MNLSPFQREEFIKRFHAVQRAVHNLACERGEWPVNKRQRELADIFAMMIHKVGSVETATLRTRELMSGIQDYLEEEIALAQLLHTILDYADARELRLGSAILVLIPDPPQEAA